MAVRRMAACHAAVRLPLEARRAAPPGRRPVAHGGHDRATGPRPAAGGNRGRRHDLRPGDGPARGGAGPVRDRRAARASRARPAGPYTRLQPPEQPRASSAGGTWRLDLPAGRPHARDRPARAWLPVAWSNSFGGFTIGLRERTNYLGSYDRGLLVAALATGAGATNRFDVYGRWGNPIGHPEPRTET